jgi:hypothetical protein
MLWQLLRLCCVLLLSHGAQAVLRLLISDAEPSLHTNVRSAQSTQLSPLPPRLLPPRLLLLLLLLPLLLVELLQHPLLCIVADRGELAAGWWACRRTCCGTSRGGWAAAPAS